MRQLLILLFLCAPLAYSQVTKMYSVSGRSTVITHAIDKSAYSAYEKILSCEVLNDTTSTNTDTLYVCFNADSGLAYRFPLRGAEGIYFASTYITTLRVWGSVAGLPYRVRFH